MDVVSTEILRKQIMVSQFVNAVGCSPEEATQILTSARWQIEVQELTLELKNSSCVESCLVGNDLTLGV